MTQTRLIPLLVLLFAACHPPKIDDPRPDAGEGGAPDAGTSPSFTVHIPDDIRATLRFYSNVHVLLGDGSRFREPVDSSGVARFHDPSITGPQDVSLVMVSSTGTVQVNTYLAINRAEVWLPGSAALNSAISWKKQGTITGRVTGTTSPQSLSVVLIGKGFHGFLTGAADGSFSIDVQGDERGRVDLFARETELTGAKVLRVGLKKDIAVAADTVVSGQDIALDHPLDQSLDVTEQGNKLQGAEARVSLRYILGGQLLFSSSHDGKLPLSVPAIALTGPFETFTPVLRVSAGDAANLPRGEVQTDMPVGRTSSAAVTLLSPVSIASPAVGTLEAPASASRSGLVLRWNHDASAHMVELELASKTGPGPLGWRVMAPAAVTSFTPFPLPADIAPVTTFPAGSYRVEATATWRGNASGYEDSFTGTLLRDPYAETRTTRLRAYVELQ
ncbi:hypothetical protein [Archangium sp.]|jgi:hypothetical protein|uniref:hypothetical protein n=1 Tax=Archangium sp. TaxID=1872627 RepID=UPI002ED986D6